MRVLARAARTPGAALQHYEYDAGPLGPLEVDVRVTHCGVCATDVGLIDDQSGATRFPVVAGHEAVGIVEAVGGEVDRTRLEVGMRVGVGAVAGSCYACEFCLDGRQSLCPARDDTAFRGHRGGFANHVRAGDWRHVQLIPDILGSAEAAPLLCAGATVFPPLLRYGVRPGDRVAVTGIGGLGHLAVMFAAAWGCEVTAITSSPDKAHDARAFGATEVIAANDVASAASSFDLLLATGSADLPWDDYTATLRPRGVLCLLGVPPRPVSVSALTLLPGERSVTGGLVGSPQETARMLRFAAAHDIRPRIERFDIDDADHALARVRGGSVRYRAVLEFPASTRPAAPNRERTT